MSLPGTTNGGAGEGLRRHLPGGHTLLSQRKATCQILLKDEMAERWTPVRSMPEWEAIHRTNQGQADAGWVDVPTALNMWDLLTAWVEDQTEPGWLATNFDGNVRHSKEAGLGTDPLQYQLEAMAGEHSHLQ